MQELKDKIRELRKKTGLSQSELADKIGVVRQTVSKWESGFAQPGFNDIKFMCEIFGISSDYLIFSGEEKDCSLNSALPAVSGASAELAVCGKECSISDNFKLTDTCADNLSEPYRMHGVGIAAATGFAVGVVLLSAMLTIALIVTVYIGCTAFTPNSGFITIKGADVDGFTFAISLTVALIIAAADVLCIVGFAKTLKNIRKVKNN